MTPLQPAGASRGWTPSRVDWLLLRRDWILNRLSILMAAFVFATFQVLIVQVPLDLPYIWVFITCTWASFLTLGPLGRDEKYRGAAWSCTLPVSRPDLVRARYVGAWCLVAAAYLLAVVMTLVVPGSTVSISFVIELDTLLVGATIVSVTLAFLLPSVIRFGMRGVLVLLLPVNVVLPITFVISKATGTQDSLEGNFLAGLAALATVVTGIRDGLSRPLFYLVVVLFLFTINWASYRLAVALFSRREL